MISKLYVIESPLFQAPDNLALEAWLTGCAGRLQDAAILYLWQNEKTVVIGKNQNAWRECRVLQLMEDGGCLVRRLSGGGAVFHDLGNLNVSFCVPRKDENTERQTGVILNALHLLGVHATANGRNDLELDGRKFSGHAAYRQREAVCHHCTLMLHVDSDAMERYLSVSPLKLRSKAVDSVRARVVNLSDRFPSLTIPALLQALKESFGNVYGLPVQTFDRPIPKDELTALRDRFASWEWTYGRQIPFDIEEAARFDWGEAVLQLQVSGGVLQHVTCYTDAMDPVWTERMSDALQGVRFTVEDIGSTLTQLSCANETEVRMRQDLSALFRKLLTGALPEESAKDAHFEPT